MGAPIPDKTWAKRMARLLAVAKISPAELSRQLGVARSTAYSWCAGTRIPSRAIQPRLARRLRTTVAELNGWPA